MFRLTLQRRWVLFTVFFLASAIAQAALVWTDRADFEANRIAAGFFLNTFSETHGTVGDPDKSYSSGGFSYTISTGGGDDLFVVTPTTGGQGNAMSTTVEASALHIEFTSGNVTAVGANFFLTRVSEVRESGSFTITLSDLTVETVTTTGVEGTLPFRGFTTDPGVFITSIDFQPVDVGGFQEYATLDNLSVGISAVPEPSHTGLIAALFLVACSLSHIFRRKQAASRLSEVVS